MPEPVDEAADATLVARGRTRADGGCWGRGFRCRCSKSDSVTAIDWIGEGGANGDPLLIRVRSLKATKPPHKQGFRSDGESRAACKPLGGVRRCYFDGLRRSGSECEDAMVQAA